MQAHPGTVVCKFGGDRVMFVVEEAIFAKFTDGQTDGRRTPRDCISSWNELIIIIKMVSAVRTDATEVPMPKTKSSSTEALEIHYYIVLFSPRRLSAVPIMCDRERP